MSKDLRKRNVGKRGLSRMQYDYLMRYISY